MVKLQDSTSPLTSNKQPHKEKRREEKRAVVLAGDYFKLVNQKPVLSFDNIAAPIFENYSHRQVFSYHLPENFVTAVRLLSE
ncbi:TPA: hypothetical protein TXN53_000077 [Streptococcus suis]|nr:hypothetical protein [Streptococcus suis]